MSGVARKLSCVLVCSWPLVATAAPVTFDHHSYEYVSAPGITWQDAETQASSLSLDGMPGYLATITSGPENALVTSLLPIQFDVGAYLGGQRTSVGPALTDGWTRITGEPWGYTNWALGEPNSSFENFLVMWLGSGQINRARGSWNDGESLGGPFIAGYVIEWNVPEASAASYAFVSAALFLAAASKSRSASRRVRHQY